MYFDTHAHYDDRRFKQDQHKLLSKELPNAGVDYIVNIGCDMRTSENSIALADKYENVYATVGYHPNSLKDIDSEAIEKLRKLAEHKKVVAIGEMGLDYHYDTYPKEFQKFWFLQQLRLAKDLDLPVVIHSREASSDTFEIMKRSGINKGIIHCYSGASPMALEYAKLGFYIGVGGVITFSNAKRLIDSVKAVGLENIVIETDCPYLTPEPNRGKRNESSNLKYVVEKIGELKNISPEEVAKITSENAKKVYNIH